MAAKDVKREKPRPVAPPSPEPPTQTELDRQRAADEGMTEAPPGTPGARESVRRPPPAPRREARDA